MKRKLVGLLLCLPLALIVPTMVKTCHRGGSVQNASGDLVDNLLTAVFILGVPMAIVGLILLLTKKTSRREDAR
jgi:hypothetical protein